VRGCRLEAPHGPYLVVVGGAAFAGRSRSPAWRLGHWHWTSTKIVNDFCVAPTFTAAVSGPEPMYEPSTETPPTVQPG
jgi:hypothetical protein